MCPHYTYSNIYLWYWHQKTGIKGAMALSIAVHCCINTHLFCSLAVLDPRVGHIMDVLSPFISVLCHSVLLFHGESCPRSDVVHPAVHGLPRLRAPGIVPCINSFSRQLPCFLMVWPLYANFLAFTVSNSSVFTPALLRTHSFVFFAVHKTCRIFLSPFISKATRRVSSFFLSVQLSQPYTSAFISRIFIEIGS